jgi:hypothetical protein
MDFGNLRLAGVLGKEQIMPVCPSCEYEYGPGVTACPDCSVELVERIKEDKPLDEEMITIFTAKDETEAKIVKGILEESGIDVFEKSDFSKSVHPFADGMADEELAVPMSQAEDAIAVIDDYRADTDDSDEDAWREANEEEDDLL